MAYGVLHEVRQGAPQQILVSESPLRFEGCHELWLTETSGAKLDAAARLKMASWKTMLSDKGLAAGFQPSRFPSPLAGNAPMALGRL